MVDFDKANTNAALLAFPEAEIKGCYFHLCQSLVMKIQSVGLKSEFECNMECIILLKSLAALRFVPADDVKVVFGTLAQSFPDKESYNAVPSYCYCTYIEGAAGRTPMFPVKILNHFDSAIEECPKTINCGEGFHNALNSVFHCSHPSVWYLFDGLQRDMACHKLTSVNTEAGRPEVKNLKYANQHKILAESVRKYSIEDDVLKYLRKMANLF